MKTLVSKAALGLAVLTLAACAGMQDSMPDWMPGSGAAKVSLSGAEEVPPAQTSGSGSGSFRVASDGAISGSVTTSGVQGTMAHIHQAPKGRNGPVIIPLVKKDDTYSVPEGRKLTDAQMKAFKDGSLYVNVHSNRYKGGEVRAQLQP
jgi:hypothetical protein